MKKRIITVAIANRGEVAVRIIRACNEMGLKTLLLHSEADVKTRAYRMADKKICIGPAATNESYLSIANNIQGALAGGADAVHPGFGFLSENADFAEACTQSGLTFIGPSSESVRTLGDKVKCKELVKSLGLPLVPGYQGENQNVDFLVSEAERIGFPVIVKAAAGGGGRGMKVLKSKAESKPLIESAQREALSAFGSSQVFLEKYLDRAKHIEFQIFGDATGKVVHLFDRECSVQRRHQKIIEEATSPSLTNELREKMGNAAVQIASRVSYRGAGTVEFLLQDDQFYFLEVNTRLQVEHPVTEMVLGVDLVKAQLMTAMGEPVFMKPLQNRGSSIECRLYAENPFMGGIPSTGLLGFQYYPEGFGRRFEYGFDEGDEITPYYDPMIAKLIVWDESRPRAIQKMLRVLDETVVFGVNTNIPLLKEILSHPEFVDGKMTTRFFETYFSKSLPETQLTENELQFISMVKKGQISIEGQTQTHGSSEKAHFAVQSPWNSYWRGI